MSKKQKIWTIVLVILGLSFLGNLIGFIVSGQNDDGLPVGGYYLGETLNYKDIDITIDKITCG